MNTSPTFDSKVDASVDAVAAVYAAIDPQMTPQDAADIGNLLMPGWSPAQHREAGLAQQAIAQLLMGPDEPAAQDKALQAAAAAYVHLSAAGQQPSDCIAAAPTQAPSLPICDEQGITATGMVKSAALLGTTASGKAVTTGSSLPKPSSPGGSRLVAHGAHLAQAHPEYSKQDHFDASFMHARAAKAHGVTSATGRHHLDMANAHVFAAPLKKSHVIRKGQQMITLSGLDKLHKAKYGTAPLGTTWSGKTVHGLRQNMNAPIANGIIDAGGAATPKQLSTHIHTFNPTFTHSDHQDAAIHHKTEAAVLRGKAKRSTMPAHAIEHMANAERHTALATAHYHAAKATGKGTGPSRKRLNAMKSDAANVLKDYLSKGVPGAIPRASAAPRLGANALSKNALSASRTAAVVPSLNNHIAAYNAHKEAYHAQKASGNVGGTRLGTASYHQSVGAEHWQAMKQMGHVAKSLSKAAGEGSRGGKVIGHTKSGEPIYEKRGASNESYEKLTAKDHGEAAGFHETAAKQQSAALSTNMKSNGSVEDAVRAKRAVRMHNSLAQGHKDEADRLVARKQRISAQVDSTMLAQRNQEISDGVRRLRAKRGVVAKSEAWMDLFKAEKGEGSRGGHVIGHTKSGHPIYGPSHAIHSGALRQEMNHEKRNPSQAAASVYQTHKKYNAEDHLDASAAHKNLAEGHKLKAGEYFEAKEGTSGEKREHLDKMGTKHRDLASFHANTAKAHVTAARYYKKEGSPIELNARKSMAPTWTGDSNAAKSFTLNTLSLSKGFFVAPNTYFWGQAQSCAN